MNIEKQTYLNTLRLEERYRKTTTIGDSFPSDRPRGGIRFYARGNGKVRLTADFRTTTSAVTLYLDGMVIAHTVAQYFSTELTVEKGEHLFEASCVQTHTAFTLTVEGSALEKGRNYTDRVGGASGASECNVYVKRGNGSTDRYHYASGSLSRTALSEIFYDEAYLYDRTQQAYGSTKRYCYATGNTSFSVHTGTLSTLNYADIGGLAMCDALTLETGADYLVAFVDQTHKLRFLRATENGTFGPNESSETAVSGVIRVVSAQKGSIFLAEDEGHFWTGYYFHANGDQILHFPQHDFHYETIPLCRNRYCSPNATVAADGSPIFYYKKEDGALMRLAYEGLPQKVAYADAYFPMISGGLLQQKSEVAVYTI